LVQIVKHSIDIMTSNFDKKLIQNLKKFVSKIERFSNKHIYFDHE
jgi:hypothetical protein